MDINRRHFICAVYIAMQLAIIAALVHVIVGSGSRIEVFPNRKSGGEQPTVQPQPQLQLTLPSAPPKQPSPLAPLVLPPAGSRYERFLFPCVVAGRHHNQLIVLAKAWSIALRSNRTLVLPDFIQAPDSPSEPVSIALDQLRTFAFEDAYDLEALRSGPVRIVRQQDFFSRKAVPAAGCFKWRRCTGKPQAMRCARSIGTIFQSTDILLGLGSELFWHNVRPPMEAPCMWHFLRPAKAIAAEVRALKQVLPAKYLAVHQRTFGDNPSCAQVLQWFWERYNKKLVTAGMGNSSLPASLSECRMAPDFVATFRSGRDKFFLGTDNYHRQWTLDLTAAGGIRYQPAAEQWKGNAVSVVATMLVDTWAMVESDVFIGNPLSTLTWNVCSLRWVAKRGCPNMPPSVVPTSCFPYPDGVQ